MRIRIGNCLARNPKSEVLLIKGLNALLFFLFAFLFLGGVQVDVVHLVLYPWTGNISVLWLRVIIIVFLGLLMVLHWKLDTVFPSERCWHALTYFPFFLIVAFITVLPPCFLWGRGMALGFFMIVSVVLLRKLASFKLGRMRFWGCVVSNISIMLVSFFVVILLGNTHDVLHYELRVERDLSRHDERKALETASSELATSQRLLALRAYALARTHSLGDRLFEYPQVEGNTDLFLHTYDAGKMTYPLDSVRAFLGFLPEREMTAELLLQQVDKEKLTRFSPLADYLLCTLLLQKNLPVFASWLSRIYSLQDRPKEAKLPRYYREALVLYNSLYVHPSVVFHSAEIEENYSDFKELAGRYAHPVERKNYLRRMYGDTYWWYYYCFPLKNK